MSPIEKCNEHFIGDGDAKDGATEVTRYYPKIEPLPEVTVDHGNPPIPPLVRAAPSIPVPKQGAGKQKTRFATNS